MSAFDEGMKWCGMALDMDPSLVDVLCDRAELYISNEMYDEAIKDYQTANGHNDQYQRVSLNLWIESFVAIVWTLEHIAFVWYLFCSDKGWFK